MISDADVWAVAAACLESFCGQLLDEGPPGLPVARTAHVAIHGAHEGAVEVGVSEGLAARAARAVFATDAVDDDDIATTLLEITNMIGGNLKAMVAQPSRLGLPEIGGAPGPVVQELSGTSAGETVRVRLIAGGDRG